MQDFKELFSQESNKEKSSELFANFLNVWNPLRISKLVVKQRYKTQHLSMKEHGNCENHVREIAKSCEISVLGFKGTSSYSQATSSNSFRQDSCRSLSFG